MSAIETMRRALLAELLRQAAEPGGPWTSSATDAHELAIDGSIDLDALATAALAANLPETETANFLQTAPNAADPDDAK